MPAALTRLGEDLRPTPGHVVAHRRARAPAPIPGVDLSLMLWAGHTLEQIPVGDYATRLLTPRRSAEGLGPDLFATMLTDPAPVEPPHTIGAHHTGTEEASDAAGINESAPA